MWKGKASAIFFNHLTPVGSMHRFISTLIVLSSTILTKVLFKAEAMLKHYKNACLLVEFTQDKAFSLQAPSDITTDIQVVILFSFNEMLLNIF